MVKPNFAPLYVGVEQILFDVSGLISQRQVLGPVHPATANMPLANRIIALEQARCLRTAG